MIPKIAHFYWGNEFLPFMNYLTIKSFRRYHPSWKICLHLPKERSTVIPWVTGEQKEIKHLGKNYLENAIEYLANEVTYVDFQELGVTNDTNEVHKSDIYRWYLLSTVGGLWSDMDIVYQNPIENFLDLNKHSTVLCHEMDVKNNKNINYIGFLLSEADNEFFRTVFHTAKNRLNNTYQCAGCEAIDLVLRLSIEKNYFNMPYVLLYCIIPQTIRVFMNLPAYSRKLDTTKIIGLHWYNGSPVSRELILPINPTNIRHYKNSLFGKLVLDQMS